MTAPRTFTFGLAGFAVKCAVLPVAVLVAVFALTSCVVDEKTAADPESVKRFVHGRFQVSLAEETSFSEPYTTVLGRVTDGATPSTLQWDTTATSGTCKLLIPRAPFCETPCGSGAACVADGVCRAYPAGVNVGTVTLTGVKTTTGATSFTMQPVLLNYQPAGTTLAFPPFAEGDAVVLSVSADSIGTFSLAATGIAPLAVAYDSVIFADGQPVILQWTPPSSAASTSTVSARFDISHHGGVKGVIECEAPDNGSLTVDASLVTQLKALGISGFPTVELSRHSASPARNDMSLELRIESATTRPISIPGLVSCSGDEECPTGQTCQQDLKCQ